MKRLTGAMAASVSVLVACQQALAYRPFDSTDAAVADVHELEIEFGPVGYQRSQDERVLTAPAYVINYGFAKNWELVLEGRLQHPLAPADDTRSRLVDSGLFLKGVLREGSLQNQSGPSIATEFGMLLPDTIDDNRFGASWLGIVSQRWSWGTIHVDAGVSLTRAQNGDVFLGTIVEGPYEWTIRPVAEVVYEREFNVSERFSILGGAIWKLKDNLSLDFGIRQAWINNHPEIEVRAGLTLALSLQQEAIERTNRSLRK